MDDVTWWVYVVRAQNGKLYTGIAKDVDARFAAHCEGRGAKFFRSSPPVAVVYREGCYNKGAALSRERAIKKISKCKKEALILNFSLVPGKRLSSTGFQE